MKKAISAILVLCMLLGLLALVPVSAADGNTAEQSSTKTSGRVYFENDFDSLKGKSSKEILEALGWGSGNAYQTLSVTDDGQLRIVSKYTKSEGSKTWADAYNYKVAQDDRIRTSTTVIEYDMTYQRNTEDTYGQSAVQGASFCGANVKATVDGVEANRYWYTNIRSSGGIDNYFRDGNAWNLSLYSTQGASSYTTPYDLEYEHNDGAFDTPNTAKCIYGQRIHVRITLDKYDGISVYMNGKLVSTLRGGQMSNWVNKYAEAMLSDTILLYVKPGMDVLFDNMKIYEYVPELVISEVMVAAGVSNGGNHEWIEVTNNASYPINVYDFCMIRDTEPGIGKNTLGSAGKDFGFMYPGEHTFTYYKGQNDSSYVYQATLTNPAYEEGVLQPGEVAMLLVPTNAIGWGTAGNSATLDTFRAYIKNKLGYGGDVKAFFCYNDYNFTLNNFNIVMYATARVTNTGADNAENYTPVCAAAGDWNNSYGLYESYVMAAHDASKTVINMNGQDFPCYKAGQVDCSVEFSCYDENGNVTRRGNACYGVNDKRGDAGLTNSAGSVPVDCRRTIDVTTIDRNGKKSVQLARLATDFVPAAGENIGNFRFAGWKDANGEPVESVPNVLGGFTLTAVYERFQPEYYGYQTTALSEQGTYSVRFVSVMDHLDYESIGYKIEVTAGEKTAVREIRCKYVYTSILQKIDGNEESVTAEELGGKYIFALHIENIPASAGDVRYVVTPFTVSGTGELVYGEAVTLTIPAPVAG